MTTGYDEVLEQASRWRAEGRRVALATVLEAWGSAPRPPGSQLAIEESGQFQGSVSGGCIEGAVVTEGLAAIADGQPRNLTFGITDDEAWAHGLACGGKLRVYVEPVA